MRTISQQLTQITGMCYEWCDYVRVTAGRHPAVSQAIVCVTTWKKVIMWVENVCMTAHQVKREKQIEKEAVSTNRTSNNC